MVSLFFFGVALQRQQLMAGSKAVKDSALRNLTQGGELSVLVIVNLVVWVPSCPAASGDKSLPETD